MITVFLVVVLVYFWAVWYIRAVKIDRKLSSVPGLPTLPFFGNALLFVGDGEKIISSLEKIANLGLKYRGIAKVWLGPKLYVAIANPEDTQVVLENCLAKDNVYRFMKPWLGDGLFIAPVNLWKAHRRVLVPIFHNKVVHQYLEIVSTQSDLLVSKLGEQLDKGQFDVFPYITACTLDIVFESSMGKCMEVQQAPNTPYLSARQIIMTIMNMRLFKLWLHPDCLFNLTPYAKEQEHNIKVTRTFSDKVIKIKREEFEQNKANGDAENKSDSTDKIPSILDLLFGREINFTNEQLREHIDSITIAGNDATALTISFVLVLLGIYPEIQEKVYQEQQSIFGSNNKNARATKEDLLKMTYLERVIKESMRLYPAVPIVARHIDKDTYLPHTGVTLPAGTGAVIGAFALHKSKEIWGPDVYDFDPDRFLPERSSNRHPAAFVPFSYGSRNCIGRNLGWLLIKGILSNVCRAYTIKAEDIGPLKIEMLLYPVNGHRLQILKR